MARPHVVVILLWGWLATARPHGRADAGMRLALRGGSSPWSEALVHASATGRNDLSLEEACTTLRLHGLAPTAQQVVELLRLTGAKDFERVSEAHFSAALAAHPPSSVLGRWQQRARFQAACLHTMSDAPPSRPAVARVSDTLRPGGASGAPGRLEGSGDAVLPGARHAEFSALPRAERAPKTKLKPETVGGLSGWASVAGADGDSASGEEKSLGKPSEKPREQACGGEMTRGTRNSFAALADHGADKGSRGALPRENDGGDINMAAGDGDGDPQGLVRADDIAVTRRQGAASKQVLKVLKPLMSLSEWSKLSSAKQRKKIRKLATRDRNNERLRTHIMAEAQAEEDKLQEPAALSIGKGSGRLSMVPSSERFDASTAGRGMELSQGALVVRKAPGVSMPTYVFWGSDSMDKGISRWVLRIDRKRNSFYVGAALLPLEPDEGFAKFLQSSAWMLADTGVLYQTQQGTTRNPLRDRLVPSPDGGHTVEVKIPGLGTSCFTAKNKYRKHKFAFKDGSLVKMELHREAKTLRFCVDNKQWITLDGVSPHARPFINFFTAGDGATILQAESGHAIPADLI